MNAEFNYRMASRGHENYDNWGLFTGIMEFIDGDQGGVKDDTWGNNVCPSFRLYNDEEVFVNYKDEGLRETDFEIRLCTDSEECIEFKFTEIDELLAAIRKL